MQVKHKLSLKVERVYSTKYLDDENYNGETALGYNHYNNSNWHLALYESRIKRLGALPPQSYQPNTIVFVAPNGNWIHFGYSNQTTATATYSNGNKLRTPDQSAGSVIASVYFPIGSSTSVIGGNRQTTDDITLWVLHDHVPTSADDRVASSNIIGYVVRYGNGTQYHYYGESGTGVNAGHLRYVDANWRNNVPQGTSGHVDDYLRVAWTSGVSRASNNTVAIIDKVYAPPSDGRFLRFNHPPLDPASIPPDNTPTAEVSSIDMGLGSTVYSGMVTYGYLTNTGCKAYGKLWRVRRGSTSAIGLQYDYGMANGWDGSGEPLLEQSENGDLAKISEYEDLGNGQFRVTPFVFNELTGGPVDMSWYMAQWMRDPSTNDWRKEFHLLWDNWTLEGIDMFPPEITYDGGVKRDGSGRYNNDVTHATILRNYNCDQTQVDVDSSSCPNPPQNIRRNFGGGGGTTASRLLQSEDLNTPDGWVNLKSYNYVSNCNGIARFSSVSQGGLTTSYEYNDPYYPETPSAVNSPDGSRVEFVYNSLGQFVTMTKKQLNTATSTYETELTTTYSYNSSGVNAGLVSSVTNTQINLPAKTTTYAYSTTDGNKAGQLLSTTYDGNTTSYTYDDFDNALTVQTSTGTITNVYSGSTGQSDTTLPPRVVKTTDPTNSVTSTSYEAHGLVSAVTAAWGTSYAKRTAYSYDRYGNTVSVSVPGQGTTNYSYDIFGHLLSHQDAGGSITNYVYDAYGRLVKETAMYAYIINYTYVTSSGGCSSCGGGSDKIAKREIVDYYNANNRQTIYYAYDLLGRLAGKGTTQDANDVIYVYSGARLDHIEHHNGSSLWGTGNLSYQYDSLGRMMREYYPNNRYIEYAYDSAGRLASVKDPYGFVNAVGYDNDNRLGALTHSELGTAGFYYNNTVDNLLTAITLGNTAYTQYEYDAYQRLTAFEHFDGANYDSVFRHSWGYDPLGRKGTLSVNVPALEGSGSLTPTYDDASRLTGERLLTGGTQRWNMNYTYDNMGNRTYGGGYAVTRSYGSQNRESGVSLGAPLQYDFKGNVTVRPGLADGGLNPWHYKWDAYDRLTSSTRIGGGGTTVNYTYDALGRLLKRASTASGTTYGYWLGLNKITEEKWVDSGADMQVFRPDNEVGATPEQNGWCIQKMAGGGSMAYMTDSAGGRGQVLHLGSGSGAPGAGVWLLGDTTGDTDNPYGHPWNETTRFHVGLWVRSDGAAPLRVGVLTRLADNTQYNLNFVADSGTNSLSGGCATYHLNNTCNTNFNDGAWHYLELDVQAYAQLLLGQNVAAINGLVLKGCNIYVDDIVISGAALGRSYQLNPEEDICVCLGSFSIDWHNQATKVYYQYNDLGTVVATTNPDGIVTSLCEPDHFGNYRSGALSGTRSDTIGLTGKFLDTESGLYYFNARWYDAERGRWLSKDRIGFGSGMNLYEFIKNDTLNKVDPTGLVPADPAKCQKAADKIVEGYGGEKYNKSCLKFCLSGCMGNPDISKGKYPGSEAAYMSKCVCNCDNSYKCTDALVKYDKCLLKANKNPVKVLACHKYLAACKDVM